MVFPLQRLSIRTQIFLLALVIVLPVAALLAWFLGAEVRHAREAAYARVKDLSDDAAMRLQIILADHEAVLRGLARRPAVRALEAHKFDPFVPEFLSLNTEFKNLGVRDLEGNNVYSYIGDPSPAAVGREFEWFKEGVSNGRFTASNVFYGRLTRRWVSMLTYPTRDEKNRVSGLLNMSIDLLRLNERIFRRSAEGAVVVVIDRAGNVALRSADAASFIGKPAHPDAEHATRGMREGFLTIAGVDGVSRLYHFQTLPDTGWRVVAGVPETEIFSEYRTTLLRTLMIGACVMLLALGLAWRVGAAIVRPMTGLAQTAARVAGGDSGVRAEDDGPAEVAAVSRQFNRMLDARERSDAAASESERFLRGFADHTPALTSYWDTELRCVFANQVFAESFGASAGTLAGRHMRDVVGADVFAVVEPHARAALRGEEQHFERTLHSPSGGGPGHALVYYAPDVVGGEVKGFFSIAFDVSAIKRTEAALRESEQQLRLALRGADLALWDLDPRAGTLVVNARWLTMLGLEPGTVPTLELWRGLVHPRDRQMMARMVGNIAANPAAREFEVEVRARHRDGHYVWILDKGAVVERGADGIALRIVGTHMDITERKLREEQLLRFRAAMDVSADAIYLTDRTTLRFLDVNTAACSGLGMTREEALRIGPAGVLGVAPEELEKIYDEVISSNGRYPVVEMWRPRPNGQQACIEVRRHALRSGEGWVIVSVTHDITARRQDEAARASLETQLRESQKMQAVGTLAGGVAHDFNNIIATILGNAELAREDAKANPVALQSLDEIRKAGARARDLVQQILSFSRRQPTERRCIALAPVVEEATRLLRATLPARLTLQARCAEDVPRVLADATQIQQVIINLATNAMQAMKTGPGVIDIALDTVLLNAVLAGANPGLREMHGRHPGRTVRLVVKDTGAGMDEATLSRIFEPFFTTKAVDEGTGLGLSVVHGIVQTHEGVILVDSQPGRGATFSIYLPVASASEGAAVPVEPVRAMPPAAAGGLHLLYIDDDESLVFLVKRLLERRGYRVSGHTDQAYALAMLRADPQAFDLVLTDYNMSGMSGLDVAREVRVIRDGLPVAIASGFIDEALREQAAAAGVRELIFKATEVEEFCEAVQRLAESRAPQPRT
jgi:PAS domain S-box-containing protein